MPLQSLYSPQGLEGTARGAEMRIYGQRTISGAWRDHDAGRRPPVPVAASATRFSRPAPAGEWRQCPALADPGRELLGPARSAGCKPASQKPSTWNLIGQQTPLGTRNFGTPTKLQYGMTAGTATPLRANAFTGLLGRLPTRNNVVLGGDVMKTGWGM